MSRDFPGGPVVKNSPCNAGDMGLVPGWGTNIPHAMEHLGLHVTTKTRDSQINNLGR